MTVRLSLLVALIAGGALAGCDNTIEAPPSLGTYTLWGALDPTAAVQSLRVVPVKDTIGAGSTAPLPVTVVSVDLATGAETAWRDSVVTFPGRGGVAHIYRAAFRPAYGSRHRVVVRREDGSEVSALVAVPPTVELIVQPARRPAGKVTLPVLWPGAPQVNRVSVTYLVQDRSCGTRMVTRPLFGTSGPVEFGWQTALDLSTEAEGVIRQLGLDVGLRQITVRGEVASEDWRPPGGVFDFDVLAEPTALSNVRGGYGFVGAAYPAEVSFRPAPSDLAATSFIETPGCPS